jgi:hypothetical protein
MMRVRLSIARDSALRVELASDRAFGANAARRS